jgi:2-haloacid dehalogenase
VSSASETAFIFDIGGVLLDWDPRHLYRKLFDGNDTAMEAFLSTVCTPAWNESLDSGLPFAEGVVSLSKQFPEHADLIAAYDARWEEMVPRAFEDTVAIFLELKAQGHPLYALTNFSAEKLALMRKRYPFFDAFDGFVISSEVGHVKPNPEIYHILLRRYGLTAAMCLFIDDRLANVGTAERLGMSGILYRTSATLRDDLQVRGFLASPTEQLQSQSL